MANKIDIRNKKAAHKFEFIEKFVAGIQLTGTEIKSIRQGKASLVDSYCFFKDDELYIKGMHITEYSHGNINNHEPYRERKLLVTAREMKRMRKSVNEKGMTIVATRLFISNNGWAKLDIALAKGKDIRDKREDIKRRDIERDMGRAMKLG
jgi:SsrA-binding protein